MAYIIAYKDIDAYERAWPDEAESIKGEDVPIDEIYKPLAKVETIGEVNEFMNKHITNDVFRAGLNMALAGSSMVYKQI